jgi:transcriptional regulator with XRE-family HTH domain
MEFGERVKAVRTGAGLTQEQFASRLGVTRQAVSNWENGRNLPDIEVVIAISRTFDISLDELILARVRVMTAPERTAFLAHVRDIVDSVEDNVTSVPVESVEPDDAKDTEEAE